MKSNSKKVFSDKEFRNLLSSLDSEIFNEGDFNAYEYSTSDAEEIAVYDNFCAFPKLAWVLQKEQLDFLVAHNAVEVTVAINQVLRQKKQADPDKHPQTLTRAEVLDQVRKNFLIQNQNLNTQTPINTPETKAQENQNIKPAEPNLKDIATLFQQAIKTQNRVLMTDKESIMVLSFKIDQRGESKDANEFLKLLQENNIMSTTRPGKPKTIQDSIINGSPYKAIVLTKNEFAKLSQNLAKQSRVDNNFQQNINRNPIPNNNPPQTNNQKSMFIPTKIEFSKDEDNSIQQAIDILKEVQKYTSKPYNCNQVGITYSANNDQVEKQITPAYKNGTALTGVSGANQAQVMEAVEELLQQPKYQHLQGKFRILPITTCKHAITKNTNPNDRVDTEWVTRDLKNIENFISQRGNVVLGWQNQDTAANRFAIGGNLSRGQLSTSDAERIQDTLQKLASQFPKVTPANPNEKKSSSPQRHDNRSTSPQMINRILQEEAALQAANSRVTPKESPKSKSPVQTQSSQSDTSSIDKHKEEKVEENKSQSLAKELFQKIREDFRKQTPVSDNVERKFSTVSVNSEKISLTFSTDHTKSASDSFKLSYLQNPIIRAPSREANEEKFTIDMDKPDNYTPQQKEIMLYFSDYPELALRMIEIICRNENRALPNEVTDDRFELNNLIHNVRIAITSADLKKSSPGNFLTLNDVRKYINLGEQKHNVDTNSTKAKDVLTEKEQEVIDYLTKERFSAPEVTLQAMKEICDKRGEDFSTLQLNDMKKDLSDIRIACDVAWADSPTSTVTIEAVRGNLPELQSTSMHRLK